MSTVSKKIADEIIDGKYPEDRAVKIVRYQNCFDGTDSYGVIFEGEPLDKYAASEYVINPCTYWQRKKA